MPEVPNTLKGEILRFRFREESGEFAVAVIRLPDGNEEVVCGPMPGAEAGKTVELDCKINPAVLGGIRLDYDGKQVDGTVKNRMDTIGGLLKNTVL